MGISIWQLVIILVIVLLLFGTKRLKNLGSDLGGAVKGFKSAVKEEEEGKASSSETLEHTDSDPAETKSSEKQSEKQ